MNYIKLELVLNKKIDLLKDKKNKEILDEEYYKIKHNILLFLLIVDYEYIKDIEMIKNEYINNIIKMNKNEREEKVEKIIYEYLEIELIEKEKYNIFRDKIKKIINNLILKK